MNKILLIALPIGFFLLVGLYIFITPNVKNISIGTELEDVSVVDKSTDIKEGVPKSITNDELFVEYMEKGLESYLKADLKTAEDFYLEANKLYPKRGEPWAGLMPIYRDREEYTRSAEAAEKALVYNPLDWNIWRFYLELKGKLLKVSSVEMDKLYNSALEATRYNVNIVTIYAQFLEREGKIQSAINHWKIALQQQPNNKLFQTEIYRLELELKSSQ